MTRTLKGIAILLATTYCSLFFAACTKVDSSPAPTATDKGKAGDPNARILSNTGIGGYNLTDARDLIVPYDFYSNGKTNQLICYRPGTGICWIMNNTAGAGAAPNFVTVYQTSSGIGAAPNNYNLADSRDRIVPYDLDGTGKQDYIICYRPGTGNFWIFKNNNGTFTNVFRSASGIGTGSGNYNLTDSRDVIVPFDYYGTGRATQLLCYRPGTGICWVMNNSAGVGATPNYAPVYQTWSGIGTGVNEGDNYNLTDNRDIILPADLHGNGIKNGLLCYRPGTGIIYGFDRYPTTNGFGDYFYSHVGLWDNSGSLHYDLSSSSDRVIPYDYSSNGLTNNVVCYRPGNGICWMFTGYPQFGGYGQVVYNATNGIGSGSTFYDLSSVNDKVFAYDYDGTGKIDHLVAYRPGSGIIWIFNNALQKIF